MEKITGDVMGEIGKKGVSKAIDLIVDKYVIPKLEKIYNRPQEICLLYDLFKDYLKKKYENNKYMNTIVFQKESRTIDELYIPLTIVQNRKKNTRLVIAKGMDDIFVEPNKMLIVDTAGMGKSTLIKFLSNYCIEKEWGVPFIIELRKLDKNESVEMFMTKEIQLINNNIKEVDIRDLIRRGDFIFFLDGYDEILESDKASITNKIRDFVTHADKNSFILASREDDGLSEFGDFVRYSINDLSKKEAYELIRKYDGYGEVSENLINEIEKDENYDALKEFLGNPLMVSLLYLTYQYKGVLQYKKHIFYRQVFDALYDRHDSTKGLGAIHVKQSKLDIEDFRRVLCGMGFISLKRGEIEFDKDQIIDIINKSINIFPEIKANAYDYLQDILHAVPLFVEEGINYKWAHKSFAEYFAAVFICKEMKEYEDKVLQDMLKIKNNQRYYNMLDFCYDIDYKAVTYNLIYPVLKKFVQYYEGKINHISTLCDIETFYTFIDNVYFVKLDNSNIPKNADKWAFYLPAAQMINGSKIDFDYLSILSRNDKIIMAVQRNPVYEVIKLIFRKKMDIFKEEKAKEYPLKFLKTIDEVGIYNIFDNKQCSFLTVENYNSIISLVFHYNGDFKGYILDIRKCKEKIEEIEKEQNNLPEDFFSLS